MNRVILAALTLTMSTCLTAVAQEIPQPEELQTRVVDQVPGFWSIDEFRLISSAETGDPISPRALLRFEADVAPKKDLFVTTGEEVGPFEVIIKTFAAAETRTLYGTMDLSYRAGEWSGITNLENPVTDLGAPVDYFRNPVIELGSEEQTRVLDLLRTDAIDRTRRAIEEEQRKLKGRHEDAMAALKLKHEQALGAQRREHEAQLSGLKAEFEPSIKAEEERLAAELEELRATQRRERGDLAATQRKDLEELVAAHTRARAKLIARQNEEIATLESGYAAKKSALEERIAAGEELMKTQEALIEETETTADRDLRNGQMGKEEAAERVALFERLLGVWTGVVECEGPFRTPRISVSTRSLKRTGSGLIGEFVWAPNQGHSPSPIAIVITDDKLTYPIDFKLIYINPPRTWGRHVFDVSLHEDGIFRGTTIFRNKKCTVKLSR